MSTAVEPEGSTGHKCPVEKLMECVRESEDGYFDPSTLYAYLSEEIIEELQQMAIKNFAEVVTAKMTPEQIDLIRRQWISRNEEQEKLHAEYQEAMKPFLDKLEHLALNLKEKADDLETLTLKNKAQGERLLNLATQVHDHTETLLTTST